MNDLKAVAKTELDFDHDLQSSVKSGSERIFNSLLEASREEREQRISGSTIARFFY
jgi:hypothetical protein